MKKTTECQKIRKKNDEISNVFYNKNIEVINENITTNVEL